MTLRNGQPMGTVTIVSKFMVSCFPRNAVWQAVCVPWDAEEDRTSRQIGGPSCVSVFLAGRDAIWKITGGPHVQEIFESIVGEDTDVVWTTYDAQSPHGLLWRRTPEIPTPEAPHAP